jgi:hypothetical protein
MNPSLKKLFNEYGIASIVIAIVVLYALYMFYKHVSVKGRAGNETMTSGNNTAAYKNGGGAPRPSNPLGQNEVYSSVSAPPASGAGLPTSCQNKPPQNPADLLPKDTNSEWAQLNPAGKGDLENINLLKAGYHIGIDTVGQTLRNGNLQIRSEPPNPQVSVGPWNLSTIEPDFMRPPLEIGQGST